MWSCISPRRAPREPTCPGSHLLTLLVLSQSTLSTLGSSHSLVHSQGLWHSLGNRTVSPYCMISWSLLLLLVPPPRVYCGPGSSCVVSHAQLGSAHIDMTSKPAIIFHIAAKNDKGLVVSLLTHTHTLTMFLSPPCSYGPATQVRWLQDPKPADKAAAAVAKRPAPSPPSLVPPLIMFSH